MKLLKKVNEDAAGGAVGGGAVAAFAMPMFASLVKRNIPTTPKIIKYGKTKKEKKARSLGLGEAFNTLMEFDPNAGANPSPDEQSTGTGNFDTSEVISKLKSLETKEKTDNRDTTVFGLEDDNGGTVRVTVKNEQAAEFEKALQNYMSDIDDDEDVPEIAEMLFKLKDHFDIVDVEWPDISEDEEQEQGVEGGAPGAEGGMDGAPGAEGGDLLGGGEGGEDLLAGAGAEPPASGADTGQVTDLLTQVIDMMKADAEARKAEAKAREVEAATKQVSAKVKQEEQMLDMEAYNKSKKEEDKETKRLASLARWKHEMGSGDSSSDSSSDVSSGGGSVDLGGGQEEEEVHTKPVAIRPAPQQTAAGRVHPHDIASFILKRIK
jgi:hypothetical protein